MIGKALWLSVAVAASGVPEAAEVPAHLFAGEPRGAYRTGTFEAGWVDESREALLTRDPHDKHRVMVQVWYPAAAQSRAARAPYILAPERQPEQRPAGGSGDEGGRWGSWRARAGWSTAVEDVLTNSVIDASVADTGPFPVLIYNHGAGQPQFTATFQTEFLASHGYVVVAISHAGFNGIRAQRFTDGYVYSYEATAPLSRLEASHQLGDEQARKMSPRERAEWMWRYDSLASIGVPEAVRNVSFVLDRLGDAHADPRHRLYRRLNLDRVGVFGFSWGGSVSVRAGLDEPRVKAVINEDGGPWGLLGEDGDAVRRIERPVMIMSNGEDWPSWSDEARAVKAPWQEQRSAMAQHYWTLLAHSSSDWYWMQLANSDHYDFSDRPLFDPGQGAGDPGHIHPRLAHAIINNHALEFFDRYLRGREDTPLLSGAARYRDALLLRRSGSE